MHDMGLRIPIPNWTGYTSDESKSGSFSSQADELLAEAKKIAGKEEERIRQIKAETQEWKKIQKSLELEASARERERATAKMGSQGGKDDSSDTNSLLSVFDGLMYVLGDTEDETIGTSGRKAIAKSDGQEIEPEVVPVLSRWKQNPSDRSITGYVRNSPDFENGTEITISTVRRNVKKGTVVTTLSGKQYKLN